MTSRFGRTAAVTAGAILAVAVLAGVVAVAASRNDAGRTGPASAESAATPAPQAKTPAPQPSAPASPTAPAPQRSAPAPQASAPPPPATTPSATPSVVAPQVQTARPDYPLAVPVSSYTLVAPDLLRLVYGTGDCAVALDRVVVDESARRVIVTLLVRPVRGRQSPCPVESGPAELEQTQVRLAAPLGDRTLVDGVTQHPVPSPQGHPQDRRQDDTR